MRSGGSRCRNVRQVYACCGGKAGKYEEDYHKLNTGNRNPDRIVIN